VSIITIKSSFVEYLYKDKQLFPIISRLNIISKLNREGQKMLNPADLIENHFVTYCLLTFYRLHRIGIGSDTVLPINGNKRYEEAERTSCNKYQWTQTDSVRIIVQPLPHDFWLPKLELELFHTI
jgi:hypothetical protein